jgi:fatty-acyl-CoA synthase
MNLPLTPIRFLYRARDVFGKKIGVICGDKQFHYSHFAERCERLAAGLRQLGVKQGDRVAYLSFNTHQLLEGYYGVVMAGGIVMPINVRLSPSELITVLNHSGASTLLFETDFAPLVEQLTDHCPAIKHYISLDDAHPLASLTSAELLSLGKPEECDWTRVEENSIAELFYTSGSTGSPKGVALTHRTLYLHTYSALPLCKEPETMVDLHTIPLFHANGWGRPQLGPMLGTKQVMVRRFDPPKVLALIAEHRATDMSLVQHDVSSLRQILIGGAASSPTLVEKLEKAFGCLVASGYGLTETAPILTTSLPKPGIAYADLEDRYRRQSITGWPVVGSEVRVVDLNDVDVPKDGVSIGEIIARGDNVMDGYYKEPDATAAVIRNGWFHTGDMAVWDEDGYLRIVDRKKEIIISGGENISSIEVEKAIYAHPAVFECAVVAAPDEKWGELTAEELLAFLETRLGRFKLPRIVQFDTEQLPKTGTGKIRKTTLRERFWAGKESRIQGTT